MLGIFNPTGGAAGKLRQRGFLLICQYRLKPCQQLRAFFHNGQVGGKVGVEHSVEAEASKRTYHLSCYQGSWGVVKAFTQGCSNRRGGLHHYMLLRVIKSLPYLRNMSAFGNSTYRADCGTLSTLYADYRIQVLGKCGADYSGIAAVLGCQGSNVLYSLADLHTSSAFNAFAGVTY